jgi:hypothetical protein
MIGQARLFRINLLVGGVVSHRRTSPPQDLNLLFGGATQEPPTQRLRVYPELLPGMSICHQLICDDHISKKSPWPGQLRLIEIGG